MKKWIVAMALVCLGSVANAAVEMRSELLGDCTTFALAIPGVVTTPVQVFSATLVGSTTEWLTIQEGRTWLSIQNSSQPVTSEVFFQMGLSSTSVNGDFALTAPAGLSRSAGVYIPAKGTWSAAIPARNSAGRVIVPFILTGGVDTGKVQITQCKP